MITLLSHLRTFVDDELCDPYAWGSLLCGTGGSRISRVPAGSSLDDRLRLVVRGVAARLGRSPHAVLEGFGAHLAAELPEGHPIDLMERVAGMLGAGASHLTFDRVSPDRIVVAHASETAMCALWLGLVRGLLTHRGEPVALVQPACLDAGAPACVVEIVRVARDSSVRIIASPWQGVDDTLVLGDD